MARCSKCNIETPEIAYRNCRNVFSLRL